MVKIALTLTGCQVSQVGRTVTLERLGSLMTHVIFVINETSKA